MANDWFVPPEPQAAPAPAPQAGGGDWFVPPERENVSEGMILSGIPVIGAYVPHAEAAIRAATGQGEGGSYAERYANLLPQRQAAYAQAEKESPILSEAAKIGGGALALAPVGAGALGATAARAIGATGGLASR